MNQRMNFPLSRRHFAASSLSPRRNVIFPLAPLGRGVGKNQSKNFSLSRRLVASASLSPKGRGVGERVLFLRIP